MLIYEHPAKGYISVYKNTQSNAMVISGRKNNQIKCTLQSLVLERKPDVFTSGRQSYQISALHYSATPIVSTSYGNELAD